MVMVDIDTAKVGRSSTGIPGLYLHVTPRGQRRWVFRYSRPHKAGVTEMSLGPASQGNFPQAQARVSQLRAQLAEGTDPGAHARAQQRTSITFAEACSQWLDHNRAVWSASQIRNANLLLRVHGKALAAIPVPAITEDMIHSALMPLWTRVPKQARRALNMWKCVLDYAGRRVNNPAAWKSNMEYRFPRLPKQARNHYAAMPYHQVPYFLGVLRHYQARSTGAVALEFLILTVTRLSETLKAQWSEFDLEQGIWAIPAERTKQRREHRVPLCDRAGELLHRQKEYNTGSPFVFTGYSHNALAEKSLIPYLREMGSYETVHGFRASFKTWAVEQTKYPNELIELCLAHQIGNAVEQAYFRGDALEKRRKIMEAWAAFCEGNSPNIPVS
jgi:integrase